MTDSTDEGSPVVHVIVLGAGVCGLYAALHLARNGIRVTVIEKESQVGGLATSLKRNQTNFDLGVKHLHAHDEEIFADLQSLLGDQLRPLALAAKIKFAGGFRSYPLRLIDLLTGVSPFRLAHLFSGLCLQQLKNKVFNRAPTNAEEALVEMYGKPLYQYFFQEFTTRYWGMPPSRLSATFVKRKMPKLGAVDLVKQALSVVGLGARSTNEVENALAEETLYYCADGAIAIPKRLSQEIESLGGAVICNANVQQISCEEKSTSIQFAVEGAQENGAQEIQGDHLISSIPIPSLVRLIPSAPKEVVQSVQRLRYRPIVVYGVIVNRRPVLDGIYVYYRGCSFHRISEPTQSGLHTDDPDHAVLLVELTCTTEDPIWHDTPEARNKLLDELEAENVVRRDEVVDICQLKSAFGYPIFDLGFEKHLKLFNDFLDDFPHLQSIGRQGAFCYPNMHATMRQGLEAAQSISERRGA